MTNDNQIRIDPLSVISLYITLKFNDEVAGNATGFIIEFNNKYFLVTNWHVLSGRNRVTNRPLDEKTSIIPNKIVIIYHSSKNLGRWIKKAEDLYIDDKKQWYEHKKGKEIDVVLLPLKNIDDSIKVFSLDYSEMANTNIIPEPGTQVFIIGYPLGYSTGGLFPIWKTGHIASDPDIDYEFLPNFLIDSTTRKGMSGSPVYIKTSGSFKTKSGGRILSSGVFTKFLGIYSGRIHKDSEIGQIWRPKVINDIIEYNNLE